MMEKNKETEPKIMSFVADCLVTLDSHAFPVHLFFLRKKRTGGTETREGQEGQYKYQRNISYFRGMAE